MTEQVGTDQEIALQHLGGEVGAADHRQCHHGEVRAAPRDRDHRDAGTDDGQRRDRDRVEQPVRGTQDGRAGGPAVERGVVEPLSPLRAHRDEVERAEEQHADEHEDDQASFAAVATTSSSAMAGAGAVSVTGSRG